MRRYAVAVAVSLLVTSGAFAQAVQQVLASYGAVPRTGRAFLQQFGSAIDWGEGLSAVRDSSGNYYVAGTMDFSSSWVSATGFTSSTKFTGYVARCTSGLVLDPTWGAGGIVTLDNGNNDFEITSIVIDANSKILIGAIDYNVAPSRTVKVARYNTDGTLDVTFGNRGIATLTPTTSVYFQLCLIALQSNGEIIVMTGQDIGGGKRRVRAWRLYTNGAQDLGFGLGGQHTADFAYANGSNDTFPVSLAVDASDKIYVGGLANASSSGGAHHLGFVARWTAVGANDATWGTDSGGGNYAVTLDTPQALECIFTSLLVESPSGKIIAVGEANSDATHTGVIVARFTTAGVLDTTFGTASSGFTIANFGLQGNDSIDWAAFDSAGRIVLAGQTGSAGSNYYTPTTRFTAYRFTAAGLVDTTYGSNGVVAPAPNGDNQNTSVFYGAGRYAIINPDDTLILPGHLNSDTGKSIACAVALKANGTINTTIGDAASAATVTAPTVTTSAATSVAASTATLNGSVTAALNGTTYYQFEYGRVAGIYPHRSAVPATVTISDGSSHAVSSAVTGLLSSTTYHFRLVGTTFIGDAAKTVYGSDATLTTSAGTSTFFSDTFTDPNGTLLPGHTPDVNFTAGNFWLTQNGTGSIQSNKFQTTTDVISTVNIGLTTGFTVSASMTRVSATLTTEMDLYYRINDSGSVAAIGNRMWAQHKGTTFSLVERIGGSNVTKATATQTWLQGETHTIAVTVSGTTVTATFDGGNAISYNTMTSETWTAVGMEVEAATNTADNFVVTTP